LDGARVFDESEASAVRRTAFGRRIVRTKPETNDLVGIRTNVVRRVVVVQDGGGADAAEDEK
jgi:hypothetical protein